MWAPICPCTEPAETAITCGQAAGWDQPLGAQEQGDSGMKRSKQRQSCRPLSAALASFNQGKWRGTAPAAQPSLQIQKSTSKRGNLRLTQAQRHQKQGLELYLQVVTHLLAVRQALDLCGRAEVQSLPFVSETKGPRYPHVCYRQIVDVQQRAKAGQAEEKQMPPLVASCHTRHARSAAAF